MIGAALILRSACAQLARVSKDGQDHKPFLVAVLRDALPLQGKAAQD
jgi:hypothetical protein